MERTCKKCGETKKINEFSFSNGRYKWQCKKCMCLWAKEHNNKERISKYREDNQEKIKLKAKEYRLSGKARVNYNKWKKNNFDRYKEQVHNSYLRRKDKIREKAKIMKDIWDSRSKEYQYNYRVKNKQKILASSRKYTLKSVQEINDSYAYALLKHKGYNKEQVIKYPELIECQKLITKIKRIVYENSNQS
jgi:hypothetical protein